MEKLREINRTVVLCNYYRYLFDIQEIIKEMVTKDL